MIVSTEERSFRDVVIYRDDPVFSHKTKTFATLAVDTVPGTLLTSTGEAYAIGLNLGDSIRNGGSIGANQSGAVQNTATIDNNYRDIRACLVGIQRD